MTYDFAGAVRVVLRYAFRFALAGFVPAVLAGPIIPGTWGEFSFTDTGIEARGCDPADPAGGFCIPSSGTPTVFLDAPTWTFVAPAGGATLIVTDAFESGDRFEIFDFGVSLGFTSLPSAAGLVDCGDDPVVCIATAGMSSGSFLLGAGNHAITLVPTLSPSGGGAGYLLVSAAVVEPGSLMLVGLGLTCLALLRRRRDGP
jgi:hypothetical protein